MNKDSTAYLKLILDSVDKIESFIAVLSAEDFKKNILVQSAVIMQLHVIGELAKKINVDIKKEIDLPWKKISGLRDFISHEYFGLDLQIIWDTVQEKIPEVKSAISNYIAK